MGGSKTTIWFFIARNLLIGGFLLFLPPALAEASHDSEKDSSTTEKGILPAGTEPAQEVTLDQVVMHLSKSPHFSRAVSTDGREVSVG